MATTPGQRRSPTAGAGSASLSKLHAGLGGRREKMKSPGSKPGLPDSQRELARSQPPLPVLGVRTPDADVPGVGLSAEPWLSNEGSAAFRS
jgi:hypothetical protein